MSERYSRSALLDFLKQAAMNGLINPATARSRRNAAESMLAEASAREAKDLRELNLDDLCTRLVKSENRSLRPEVVDLYRGRLGAALQDFFGWIDSPDNFQASAGEATTLRSRKDVRRTEKELARERIELSKTDHAADLLPIQIRPDCVVYVQGLPLDLSSAEARKVAAVIEAMAGVDSGPTPGKDD